jgi:Ni,Fe-hydrogenase I cytochrome b subunit
MVVFAVVEVFNASIRVCHWVVSVEVALLAIAAISPLLFACRAST